MTDHGDRLREAFESRATTTPDPAEVYARVVELSARHKWRRRGATAAGGVALGAGLIATVVNLPAVLPGGTAGGTAATSPVVAAAQPSAATSPSQNTDDAAYDAYFGAGYDWGDAVKLAKLWNLPISDIGRVKITAGKKLLAGETLPIKPNPDDTQPPDSQPIPAAVTKFFAAGYSYDDAVRLAKLWKLKTPYDAKVAAGKKLLAGQSLPFKPDPATATQNQQDAQVNAFFNAGYDYDDAVKLVKLWKLKTPYDAKVAAGKKLLAGQSLPIEP